MNYNGKTYKQARLDAFEIRELWPDLRYKGFWSIGNLMKARRASVALFKADERYCNFGTPTERAERAAEKICSAINFELEQIVRRGPRAVVRSNGLRYIEITDGVRSYGLID